MYLPLTLLCVYHFSHALPITCYMLFQDPERRSQLWRMTAEGHLVHIATSSGSTNYVLDLVEPFVKAQSHNIRNTPLQIERMNAKKAESQTWEFTQVRKRD